MHASLVHERAGRASAFLLFGAPDFLWAVRGVRQAVDAEVVPGRCVHICARLLLRLRLRRHSS